MVKKHGEREHCLSWTFGLDKTQNELLEEKEIQLIINLLCTANEIISTGKRHLTNADYKVLVSTVYKTQTLYLTEIVHFLGF